MKALRLNSVDYFTGFFTRALFLRGRTSQELEDLLGYGGGRLGQGWWLLFMVELPGPQDFEFRGYSQMSGGVARGHLPAPPDPRTAEQTLRDRGHDDESLAAFKRKFVAANFTLHGAARLAKVIPKLPGRDYPPGRGIPQWELVRARRFRVVAEVAPGAMYLGSYQ